MQDQFNVQSVSEIDDISEENGRRNSGLIHLLTNPRPVSGKLTRLHVDYTPYYLVNGLEVNADWYLYKTLSQMPGVDRVLESPRLRPLPEQPPVSKGDVFVPPEGSSWNLDLINVSQVHEELAVKGEGIVIGQTDSGVDGSHPEVKDNYRGSGSTNDYNWLDPWNKSVFPVDVGGHGTGTLGIIVGKTLGIAPQSQWIGCVNLARNLGNPAVYLDCMQFMFAPYAQGGDPFKHGDPAKGAMIINNSWGCPRVEGCDPQIFEEAVRTLKGAGVFMSVAAGNNGLYGCSDDQGSTSIIEMCFMFGAIDQRREISAFQARGPGGVDGSGSVKPDLLLPGETNFVAAQAERYTYSSGTSFAAPHCGVVWCTDVVRQSPIDGRIEETIQSCGKCSTLHSSLIGCVERKIEADGHFGCLRSVKKR